MKLKVSRPTYERRLARMVELIQMKAPAIIIYHEARMIQEAYQPSFWSRFTFKVLRTRVGLAVWSFFHPLDPELQKEIDAAANDPEYGLTNAELMARDLGDPLFIDQLSPEQLGRFVNDIANAKTDFYDTETSVRCICRPNEVSLECPVCTR